MSEQPKSLSVSRAHPTDEELAAVAAVLAGRAWAVDRLRSADDGPLAGGWKSYYRTVRAPLVYGRDAWRTYTRM